MDAYLKQLEAMDRDKREAVCGAMLGTMYAIVKQLSGPADNHLVIVGDVDGHNDPNNGDFAWGRLMCLKWLAEGAQVIDLKYAEDYKYVLAGSNGHDYLVTILNRYVFEELLLALQKIHARLTDYDGYNKSIDGESVPNLVYYDIESGRGLVNGQKVYLQDRNKRLFNELFKAAPNFVGRNALLKITRTGNYKDDPSMYVVSEAFNLLRNACKADSSVIELKDGNARLNAKVFPLSFQLFQNTYGKTKIRPKSPPK
ncbi:MAG TPA: hypothetical protein VLE99_03575 [Candidatus Saccharimonadales bacterium]|nr:hypothetical protein [Candidatus Saccharimonadales bacterium]